MSGLKQQPDLGRENSISSGQIVRLWFFFFITFHCGNRHGLFQEIIGDFSFIQSLCERGGVLGGSGPESPLIFHITVTSFRFLEVVCCKELKVFCGLGCLGMSGIGLLGSLSYTLTEMYGWVFSRTYSITQVFPNLCYSIPKTRRIVHVYLKISLF